ncbi:MAG: type II secretion system F family protein [Acidimicrobiales bacterium]|nr:type II secretion system F family protein [Acidimicrobiales bacterium]
MSAPLLLIALGGFAGSTLVLSEIRWFRRPPLFDRLAAYTPATSRSTRNGLLSVASFRDVLAPLAQLTGERLARLFGVSEELSTRLRRVHSPLDVAAFRVRQMGWTGVAFLGGALGAVATGPPAAVAALIVVGAPILAFLLLEQQMIAASDAWQRRLVLELPVIAEQMGMLLSAGWSMHAAIDRVASRGNGNCSADLRRVAQRIGQGLAEVDALREWADVADVEPLDRFVAVLALNRETADLGGLIAEEARSMRREAQRDLIEAIEKRNQQVWIPVTVAALIPGVLLMGVPFVDALSLFSTS